MQFKIVRPSSVMRREVMVVVKMLLPVIFILSIVIYFHEFVLNAINSNRAINGLIIFAALYGVTIIIIRLISAQIDFYTIDRFGREAKEIEDMGELINAPWLQKRYVRHYLGHIAVTGGTLSSALDQNAIENELQALSTEYEHKMELPQFIVGFMIAMGLLGTFIGLLETLTGISGMLDGMTGGGNIDEQFMKLVVELRKPLAGMGIAFSASMFGLVTSLMLAIMMINLRRYIGRVVSHARNVMHELTELTRAALPEGGMSGGSGGGRGDGGMVPSLTGDGAVNLQDFAYQLHDSSMATVGRIDMLGRKMETLFQLLESNVQATQRMVDLLGFGPRMRELNENMLDEIKLVVGAQVEQHKFSQRLIDVNVEASRAITNVVEAERDTQSNMTLLFKDLSDRVGRLEDSNGVLCRVFVEAKDGIISELKQVVNAQVEQYKYAQRSIDVETETSRAVTGLIEVERQAQTNSTLSMKDLSDKLGKLEDVNISAARHLFEIKENFGRLGGQISPVESIYGEVGRQTLLLETLVKEDRNLQKRLQSIHQDIRERTLALPGAANDDIEIES